MRDGVLLEEVATSNSGDLRRSQAGSFSYIPYLQEFKSAVELNPTEAANVLQDWVDGMRSGRSLKLNAAFEMALVTIGYHSTPAKRSFHLNPQNGDDKTYPAIYAAIRLAGDRLGLRGPKAGL